MKKLLVLSIAMIMLVGSVLTGCSEDTGAVSGDISEKEEIVIGVSAALSGAWQILGYTGQVGIEVAVKEINDNGGINGIPVRVIYRDDEMDPTKCMNNVQDLVINEEIDIFVGPASSTAAVAITPYLTEEKIFTMFGAVSGSGIANPESAPYAFRTFLSNDAQSEFLANYAVDTQGYTKIALVNDTTAVGATARDDMFRLLGEKGIEPMLDLTYNSGDIDMMSIAQQIKDAAPEVIIFGGGGADVAHVMSALERVDYIPPEDVECIAYTGILVPTFTDIVGEELGKHVYGVNVQSNTWHVDDTEEELLEKANIVGTFQEEAYKIATTEAEQAMVIIPNAYTWYANMMIIADAVASTNSVDAEVLTEFLEGDYVWRDTYSFSPENHDGSTADTLCLSPAIGEMKHGYMLEGIY